LRFAFVDQIKFIELIHPAHPILPVLLELMKMRIRPAHDHLECAVQATQFDGTRNLEHAPNGRSIPISVIFSR